MDRPVTILLVEDIPINAEMLTRRLVKRGFAVVASADGVEAERHAIAYLPDVILMDLSLPNVDGCEATRRIRADPATAHIPIIALTAHTLPADRERALAAGCNDFETKPLDFERLLKKIAALLNLPVPSTPEN